MSSSSSSSSFDSTSAASGYSAWAMEISSLPPPNPVKDYGLVVFEGSICAGKTTHCKALEKAGATVALEKVPQELLKLFLTDPKKYALAMQAWMASSRGWVLSDLARKAQESKTFLYADRGTLGDSAFAIANKLAGNMSDEEFKAYASAVRECEPMQTMMRDRNTTLAFLVPDVDTCVKRLSERDGVDQKTPTDYMKLLHRVHCYAVFWSWSRSCKRCFPDGEFATAFVVRESKEVHEAMARRLGLRKHQQIDPDGGLGSQELSMVCRRCPPMCVRGFLKSHKRARGDASPFAEMSLVFELFDQIWA